MQNVLTLESNKYAIKIENFEGPLDLLCHLIDKNKMNIYDIKISEIADQYIEYINKMEELNLEVTSEFLIMASTLLYIKSKMLLPKPEEEDEDPRAELADRLEEYKRYKEISAQIEEIKKQIENDEFTEDELDDSACPANQYDWYLEVFAMLNSLIWEKFDNMEDE